MSGNVSLAHLEEALESLNTIGDVEVVLTTFSIVGRVLWIVLEALLVCHFVLCYLMLSLRHF